MEFDEPTRDMFTLIKHEVVELRPDWEPLDITDPQQAIFLMVAAVALKGNRYSIGVGMGDGQVETITVEPMTQLEGERFAIAISSNRENSETERNFASLVSGIFKLLNSQS